MIFLLIQPARNDRDFAECRNSQRYDAYSNTLAFSSMPSHAAWSRDPQFQFIVGVP
jgi:hypothetical protein